MSAAQLLPFRAPLADYQLQAKQLFRALLEGDQAAHWRFKWMHPRFRDVPVDVVRTATLSPADAQLVLAREYHFENWAEVTRFAEAVQHRGAVARFETAVDAVVSGDIAALRVMLEETPDLAHARSVRRHHGTLLHYVAANGVEDSRQTTPPNAVEVAELLLDAGAEPDALADMYDSQCTTLSMLVSGRPPHEAGLQIALAETLLDHGAALDGPGPNWRSALMTALTFGFLDTAKKLAERGASVDTLPAAAGLGRVADVSRLMPNADAHTRQVALALAARLGQTEILRLLLDGGADPTRYNPDGFHSHSTPLHQAVWSGNADVVRLLVERGARLDVKDRIYEGTPLDWAVYGKHGAIADYLRDRYPG